MDHPPRSDSFRSTEPEDTSSSTTTWAGPVGSMHMAQPQNNLNASGGAPILNFIISSAPPHHDEPMVPEVIDESTVRADHEVYYHQMLTKKRGSPLWAPGPGMQLPLEYRRQGIGIGDVGIITSTGAFDFLFNIFLPGDHPINNGNVPQTFSPLQFEPEVHEACDYGPNSYLTSSSVRNTALGRTGRSWFSFASTRQTFESTSREAAILTMPDGASTQNLLNASRISQCISKNALIWYEYAIEERGRLVKNGDLRVVVGFDKVKSWGIATSACNAGQTASLTFRLDRRLNRTRYRWDCTGGSGRVGPAEIEIIDLVQNNKKPQNQSVFVRTMNFTGSGAIGYDFPLQALPLPVGPSGKGDSTTANRKTEGRHSTPGEGGASSSRQTGSPAYGTSRSVALNSMQHGINYHPSAALHACLHEKFPNASLVITQDSDWISVLNDDDTVFPPPGELVERVLNSSNASEQDGVVTIDMINPQNSLHIAGSDTASLNVGYAKVKQVFKDTFTEMKRRIGATNLPFF